MKGVSGLVVAACLCLAGVEGERRGLIQSFYKYDVCRRDFLNIAATGDTKSPACWQFSRTEDAAERYKAFASEISARQFSFYGPRDRILTRLQTYAPPSIDLKTYRPSLQQQGFEATSIPSEFKEKLLDFIAFLCCLSRQATDVKWTDEQIKRWEDLGLDVQAELAKKVFEPPTSPKPKPEETPRPKEEEPQTPPPSPPAPPPPPPRAPAPSEVSFGLKEATLTLPSGARASLHFDPAKTTFIVRLPKPVDECSMEDIRGGLAKHKEEIREKLLQASKHSELEEARAVASWDLKEILVLSELKDIVDTARENGVVEFNVEASAPEKKEETTPPSPPPAPPVPAPRKAAPRSVSFGLKEATLTLPSGARASLHFDPNKTTFIVSLSKPIDECSIEDIREGLAKHKEEIKKKLLQASKHSELEEARDVSFWELKDILVLSELKDIVTAAEKNRVVEFNVEASAPEKKEEKTETTTPPTTTPVPIPAPRKPAPSHVSFGLSEATLTLPSGARASLHFDPNKTTFIVFLSKPIDKCSIEDIREGLYKHKKEIKHKLQQTAKNSELKEARNVIEWKIKDILVDATHKQIIKYAKQNKPVIFSVSAEAPITEEEKHGITIPLPPPPPAKEEAPPSEEVKPKETEETPTETEPEETPTPKPRKPKTPKTGGEPKTPTPQHCDRFPLDLSISPKTVREGALTSLIDYLNSSNEESDRIRVVGVCLYYAAFADIYERLYLSFHRHWGPPEVIEGATNASFWLSIKLQTSIDNKDIATHEETKQYVIRNARICIDAVRVMGRLLSQKRQDRPEEPLVSPASLLGIALNISFDGVYSLSEHINKYILSNCSREKATEKANIYPLSMLVFISILKRYFVAASCQVYVHRNPRYRLAYLSLPGETEMEAFWGFLSLYNEAIARNKNTEKNITATVEKAAKMCTEITLGDDITRTPLTVGEVELQLDREVENSMKLIKGQ